MVTMLVIARQFCLVDTQRERCTGTHTFRWQYSKDASGSGGSDCIWVDHIEWEFRRHHTNFGNVVDVAEATG